MNILDPQGPIGAAEKTILIDSIAIMLAIVVPTIIAILAFAWWFRPSNPRATYLPDWEYSGRIELVVWSIPALTVILLGGVAWIGSHELDPAKPVEGTGQEITIQVVSLDWKWLFIYPDQGIASVNQLACRPGVPVHFSLTSASVMNAFFIPQLGSMIYTMNGMTTQLNLQADSAGTFTACRRISAATAFPTCISTSHAVPPTAFAAWVADHARRGQALDARQLRGARQAERQGQRRSPIALSIPTCSSDRRRRRFRPAPGPQADAIRTCRTDRSANDVRQARAGRRFRSTSRSRWSRGAVVLVAILGVLVWVVVKG